MQKDFQDVTEAIVRGETVDTDSVDATALRTAQQVAKAYALYSVGTIAYEEVCEILDIELPKEEDEIEDD